METRIKSLQDHDRLIKFIQHARQTFGDRHWRGENISSGDQGTVCGFCGKNDRNDGIQHTEDCIIPILPDPWLTPGEVDAEY